MKVLFWSENFWPEVGGVEVLAAQLLPTLRARGHDFHVLTSSQMDLPPEDVLDGIPITRLPMRETVEQQNPVKVVELRRRVAAIRSEFEPDLEHLFGLGTTLLFHRDVGRPGSRPYLITLQNAVPDHASRTPEGLIQNTFRDAAWVVACSEILLEDMRQTLPGLEGRASAIVNAVAIPELEPQPLPRDPPVLMCVGRLETQKGFDLALDAFASLPDRFRDVRLKIAGDGTERERLREHTRALGLSERVDFLGMIPPGRIPSLLQGATIVLMPSRWEGLPTLAVEAAMMGRPIIGTRVHGIPEVVLHERTGLIVPPEDSAAVAAATARLLDDLDSAAAMGFAAREHATSRFSLAACTEAYDALYRRFATQT